ncbi:MFS general substrate transporter [Rhizodiscina lignyota]|uniref:MFS general substrate transporter n=1 Tax=Rhizodiscina lignyota TaxID=1504668 RepID=A0A9P4I0T0_9PEZI|nr:MFS general substrate transporter [Rhizodiscina lignyota]
MSQNKHLTLEDPVEAKRIIKKIDYRLMPVLVLLYTVTFLDRVNIGNARLWNMEKDLHMHGYEYNVAVLVFYVPLILFEIPSNMILNRVVPRYYISGLAMCWGLTITFSGFSKSAGGLIAARVLIGFFEAGMLPGCLFLIGTWYRRHEMVTRVAWLFVSNDIAGIGSGLLGAGLGSLQGTGGYSGWSWIFFIEGAMTCIAAIVSFVFLPAFPEKSTFLRPAEKDWYVRRLRDDDRRGKDEKLRFLGALKAITDWKVICSGWLYLSVTVAAYAISIFQPTILSAFGWSDLKSNLLSAPVRAVSGIFSVSVGIWSDKVKKRAPFVISSFAVAVVGNLLVMLVSPVGVRYFGMYLAAIGTYNCQALVIAWGVNQVVGQTKLVFPQKDTPHYYPGLGTCIAFSASGIIAALVMYFFCAAENKKRDRGDRDHLRDLPEEEQRRLGERHPDFRYTL